MNRTKYLLTTRPIDDALSDCKLLIKRRIKTLASPSMRIVKMKFDFDDKYDAIFLTSRHAAHIVEKLESKNIPIFCVGSATAKSARNYGATNLFVGNSDASLLAINTKKELPKNSNIFWPSNNKCPDKVYDILKSNCFNIDKKIVYKNSSIDNLDIKSSSLIKEKQISVVLFFSLRSAKMWIELINKSNLFKFLLSVNFVVINEEVSKYLKELKFKNVSVSRRKRRASVLSLGMKLFNDLEIL